MTDVLPRTTGLDIDGISYRYTLDKNIEDAATVYIRNQHATGEGYIYERNDVWDGLPGNTKVGYDPLPSLNASLFGEGEIGVDGSGTISDVSIYYNYSYDTCINPLSSPTCPGYLDALYQYLLDNGLLNGNIDDPYYNEWVQAQLEQETTVEEDVFSNEEEIEEESKELDIEAALSVSGAAEKITNTEQQERILAQLAAIRKLDIYYSKEISGGVYEDSIKLLDSKIIDNKKALNNLINDSKHREIIRSQYGRE